MNKESIKELLEEAGNPQISFRRINEIQSLLGMETAGFNKEKGYYPIDSEGRGVSALFDSLYVKCVESENPKENFEKFAPIFYALCGERKNLFFAEIDLE